MIRKWKNLKSWKKWIIGAGLLVVLVLGSTACYLYYQVKTVDLDAIIAKHQEEASTEISETTDVNQGDSKLPSYLNKSLDTANSMTNKPINADDAIDAAAILMGSGLSMKEMSYLTGRSTENLSNEEKQKIRDLLLEKLTAKEIEALRSITSEYGKNLVILDPGYPIELVGVYDEKERQKIIDELAKRDSSSQPTATAPSIPESSLKPSESPSKPVESPSKPSESSPKQDDEKLSKQQQETKRKIEAKYKAEFTSLQKSCQAKVAELTNQVKDYIGQKKASGEEVTINDLQKKFLGDISTAESTCDQQFDEIMAKATEEYNKQNLNPSGLDNYKKQYESSKNQARSSALSQILAVWKSKSD